MPVQPEARGTSSPPPCGVDAAEHDRLLSRDRPRTGNHLTPDSGVAQGTHPRRVRRSPRPRGGRCGSRLRRRGKPPATLPDRRSGARRGARAALRRRHLRGVRRSPARYLRRRRAAGVRLPGNLRPARPRHRGLPRLGRRTGRDRGNRRSLPLVAHPRGNEVSQYCPAPLCLAGRACRRGAFERRHGTSPRPRAVPAHRRSGADRLHAARQRPGRDRGHRSDHLPAHRQPHRAENLSPRRSAPGSTASAPRSTTA